jgi:hypothetical protein
MRVFHAELCSEHRRVDRSDTKRDNCSGVAEYGMLKLLRKLRNMLVRRDQRKTPLASFRKDRCEAISRKILEFVDVQREVEALRSDRVGDVPAV